MVIRMQETQQQAAFLTVNQFAAKQSTFSKGSLRALIFNEASNGLAKSGAIIRIGRKVLINEPLFWQWVSSLGGR